MNNHLDPFLDFVETLSEDFSLVQGLGGNVSYKRDGMLLVKASGMKLGNVRDSNYFYKCSLHGREFSDDIPGQNGRPSIETFLHSFFPQTYIIHLHSHKAVAASMLANQAGLKRIGFTEGKFSLIQYATPGKELYQAIKSQIVDYQVEALLLQNHGVVYMSDELHVLKNLVANYEETWEKLLEKNQFRIFTPQDIGAELTRDEQSHVIWQAKNNWRISPDHIVFLGASPDAFLEELMASRQILPKNLDKSNEPKELSIRDEQKLWFLNVALSLPKEVLPTISFDEAMKLQAWESEKHRVQIADTNHRNK